MDSGNSGDMQIAQMLVDGDMLISDLSQRLGKNVTETERVKYIKLAQQIDPNFSPNTNKVRYNLQKRWESGDLWNNRVAINTALGHLADLKVAADELQNTNLIKYNSFKNMLKKEIGNPEIAQFEINLNLLSEELAKIYKGGNAAPTEQEMKQMKDAILSNYSPKQFSAVANKTTELLSSRLTSLSTSYKSTMGKDPTDIIDQDKLDMLRNAGIDISKIEKNISADNSSAGRWQSSQGTQGRWQAAQK